MLVSSVDNETSIGSAASTKAKVIEIIQGPDWSILVIDAVLEPANPASDALTKLEAASVPLIKDNRQIMDLLDSLKNVTVFAPENSGFESVADLLSSLPLDIVIDVLSLHVLNGTYLAQDLTVGEVNLVTYLKNHNLSVETKNDNVYVKVRPAASDQDEDEAAVARVVSVDHVFVGGVIHVIDKVLLPDLVATYVEPNIPEISNTGSKEKSGLMCSLAAAVVGFWVW